MYSTKQQLIRDYKMKIRAFIAYLGFTVTYGAIAAQQSTIQSLKNKSSHVEETRTGTEPPAIDVSKLYSKSYALLIGNNQYDDSWGHLNSIPQELDQVEELLKSQGFEIFRQNNLKSDELRKALHHFLIDKGALDHRLLIFFAGHGYTMTTNTGDKRGYIVPTDAPVPKAEKDVSEFKKAAIGLKDISIWTDDSTSKHILFLFDSCFSGSILKNRGAVAVNRERIEASARNPVRYVITAGDADEKVPGTSKFVPALLKGIRDGEADRYPDGYITSTELANYLIGEIPKLTDDKNHPQADDISNYSLQKQGEFIFTVNNSNPQASFDSDDPVLEEETVKILLDSAEENQEINALFGKKCLAELDKWSDLDHAGYVSARTLLGGCALTNKDYEQALSSADKGIISANLKVAQMHLNGWAGVEKSKKKAKDWFRKAAERGNPIGQIMLARMYLIDKKEKKASEWFLKAAEQGDASAQFAVGHIYLNSYGNNYDMREALNWFRKAALQGHRKAKTMVTELEAKGIH
jgi:hypothetical protein